MMRSTRIAAAALLAAACSPDPAVPAGDAAPNRAPAHAGPVRPIASYVGRWTGVEGMTLDVRAKAGGGATVANRWDLDSQGSYDGKAVAAGLRWTRGLETVTAVPGTGDATGLKWLASKRDCLIVKAGEGYCRD